MEAAQVSGSGSIGLIAAAVLAFVLALITDGDAIGPFLTKLGVAFGLSVASVYLAGIATRASKATSMYGLAVVVTAVACLVLLPVCTLSSFG